VQKCINFRPFLYIFLATSVGALLGYAFLVQKLVTIIAVSAILLLFFIKLLTRYKVSVFQLWSSKAFSILLLVLFFASFFNFNIQFNSFEKEKLEGMIYAVEARIAQVSEKEDSFRFILEQVAVVEAGEATLLKQNLNLTVFDLVEEINPQIGDRVLFVGAVYDYKLLKNNELNTRAYFNNLGHYANASANEVSIISGEKHFDELLQEKVKTMLFKHLSYDNASLSYAVLFGDKNLLENNYYEQYTNSGIGHLLAVSGLHIGLLVALLVLLLSGLRVPKLWQGVILFLLLFGYSYLCGFTASVLRASIMALVFLLGHTIGERNDNLSNLMFAGTVILLLSPFYLFTVGFLLSFGSVLGIVLLYPLLCKWFYKIKLPVKLSQMLAVTIAVQIAILPIVAFYFKQTNVFSWVINLLAIPLFTVGYFGLFFATVLTGITSFFSFLFVVPNLLFTFLHLLAKFVSSVGVIELF
jgi:ComEC/Rec2-related protein